MGKTIKRPNPFARYEFEYLESYLEEKARQGQILKKAGRWVLTFEEDEPREIKYRMIPETGIVDKEELESFEERGWKVVGKENGVFNTMFTAIDSVFNNFACQFVDDEGYFLPEKAINQNVDFTVDTRNYSDTTVSKITHITLK